MDKQDCVQKLVFCSWLMVPLVFRWVLVMHNNLFVKNIYRKKAVSPEGPKFKLKLQFIRKNIQYNKRVHYTRKKNEGQKQKYFFYIFSNQIEISARIIFIYTQLDLIKPSLHQSPIFVVILKITKIYKSILYSFPIMFIVLKENKKSYILKIVFINVLTFKFYSYHVSLVRA